MNNEGPSQESRAGIIQTVQTPLGFFALVVLVVEAILGVTAGLVRGISPTAVVSAMVALIFLMVLIVAGFAFFRPEALHGQRAAAQATPRLDLPQSVATATVEHVKKPSILCVSTLEFDANGASEDAAVLEKYFPKTVTPKRGISVAQFRESLASNSYSIIHLLCYVDPKEGTLRFSSEEALTAEGLERLTAICGAKLVILATCDSVVLAAKIAHSANMIAATTWVSTADFVQWENCFYNLLSRGHPLSTAYEVARATTNAPMVLLMKRDITFSR